MKIIFPILVSALLSFNIADAAKVKILVGKASSKVGKEKTNLKQGDVVEPGSTVSTGANSLTVLEIRPGEFVKLNANSEFQVAKKAYTHELKKGSVFAKIKKGNKFKIKTRGAVAGVRGTEFFTSYGKKSSKDDIWLCVNEGSVEVESLKSDQKVTVNEGEGISIRKKISDPKPLPWTRKLNWSMEGDNLENKVSIEDAYTDLLDPDYD